MSIVIIWLIAGVVADVLNILYDYFITGSVTVGSLILGTVVAIVLGPVALIVVVAAACWGLLENANWDWVHKKVFVRKGKK